MVKINQGGVECEIKQKAGKDTVIKINLSSIRRHAERFWCIRTINGEVTYQITVELSKTRGKDE